MCFCHRFSVPFVVVVVVACPFQSSHGCDDPYISGRMIRARPCKISRFIQSHVNSAEDNFSFDFIRTLCVSPGLCLLYISFPGVWTVDALQSFFLELVFHSQWKKNWIEWKAAIMREKVDINTKWKGKKIYMWAQSIQSVLSSSYLGSNFSVFRSLASWQIKSEPMYTYNNDSFSSPHWTCQTEHEIKMIDWILQIKLFGIMFKGIIIIINLYRLLTTWIIIYTCNKCVLHSAKFGRTFTSHL